MIVVKIQTNVTISVAKCEYQLNLLCIFSVEGLHAIVVTDRDGVPIVKGETSSPLPLSFSLSLHPSFHLKVKPDCYNCYLNKNV